MEKIKSETTKKRVVKVKKVPTEIYSRVVGYFRPVSNWNEGKKEEFSKRKEFRV
ncbi:MAG: anaerobic ribonucleoside-triphosphate reductase [bacterium]